MEVEQAILRAIGTSFGDRPLDIDTVRLGLSHAGFTLIQVHLREAANRKPRGRNARATVDQVSRQIRKGGSIVVVVARHHELLRVPGVLDNDRPFEPTVLPKLADILGFLTRDDDPVRHEWSFSPAPSGVVIAPRGTLAGFEVPHISLTDQHVLEDRSPSTASGALERVRP